jgi:hypothetical protein
MRESLTGDFYWEVWIGLLESIGYVSNVSLFKVPEVGFVTYLLHLQFSSWKNKKAIPKQVQDSHVLELPLLLLHIREKCLICI